MVIIDNTQSDRFTVYPILYQQIDENIILMIGIYSVMVYQTSLVSTCASTQHVYILVKYCITNIFGYTLLVWQVVIVFQHCHIVNKRIGFFCFSSASVRSPPVGISLSNHPASCFEMPCRVSWKFFLNKKICQCFTQGSALGVGLS